MTTAFEILQSKLTIADTSEFRLTHIPEILDAMQEYKSQLPQQEISDGVIPPNSFILSLNREEPIIIIDEEGFKYKGELIKDSGEIYKLFKEFLQTSLLPQQEISVDEIEKAAKQFYEENIDCSNIPRNHYEWEIQELMSDFCYKWYREQLKKKQ